MPRFACPKNLQSSRHYESPAPREPGSNPGLHTSFAFLSALEFGPDSSYYPSGGLPQVISIVEGALRIPQVVELFLPSTTNRDVTYLTLQERMDCVDKIYEALHCRKIELVVRTLPDNIRGCTTNDCGTTTIAIDQALVAIVRESPPLTLLHATAFLVTIILHQLSHYVKMELGRSLSADLPGSCCSTSTPTKINISNARDDLGSLLEEGLWGGIVVFLKPWVYSNKVVLCIYHPFLGIPLHLRVKF
jgi:hypothetical protein